MIVDDVLILVVGDRVWGKGPPRQGGLSPSSRRSDV
jgi:hypothetical protein